MVTRDVALGLDTFADRYLHELTANGVWISGFFGSGKSHLLKILSLILDGISASIRGDMQTTIKLAERQLGDGLPIRILKSLFLLKWVREFEAATRNVAILLINRPDLDIRAREKAVLAALTHLESQSYLQRNGDLYEFLTDTEKDIEVENTSSKTPGPAIPRARPSSNNAASRIAHGARTCRLLSSSVGLHLVQPPRCA